MIPIEPLTFPDSPSRGRARSHGFAIFVTGPGSQGAIAAMWVYESKAMAKPCKMSYGGNQHPVIAILDL